MRRLIAMMVTMAAGAAFAAGSEISVDLRMDEISYVIGERVRAVIEIENKAPERIVAKEDGPDRVLVEIYRAGDKSELDRIGRNLFVQEFELDANQVKKFEVFLADHYSLRTQGRYLAKPVLVKNGTRYEGLPRAFDVVPGMETGNALQLFSNQKGLKRNFRLVYWTRQNVFHLFLAIKDEDPDREWTTWDLGETMRMTKPVISVKPNGEVAVIHRCDRDNFMRYEFWSTRKDFILHRRESITDPDVAGSHRMHEIYKDSGKVKAKTTPWWRFW